MKRSRYTEEQIIAVLREHEAGAKAADLCPKYGMFARTSCVVKSRGQPAWSSGSNSAARLDFGKRFSARKSTKTRTFGATKRLEGHTARKVPACFVNSSKTTISLPSAICWRMAKSGRQAKPMSPPILGHTTL
jgi:hypothetical protein